MSRLRRPFRKGSKGYLLQNRKGTTLRQDLSKGAADIKTAFKKIKDAGKSLTRGTKDLTATRTAVQEEKIQTPATNATATKDSTTKSSATKSTATKDSATKSTVATTTTQETAPRFPSKEEVERWKARRPQLKDYKTEGKRNPTVAQRAQFQRDLEAWRAEKPKVK